jgi:membrane associated rhomboid family serine protease
MTLWAGRLIVANLIVFMLTLARPELVSTYQFVPALALQHPWTLLSYMFLHGGFGHLFFNMLSLFFFGPRVEARIGSRDFVRLYFLSGLGGALLSFLLAPYAAVIGASGAVFGVMLAFARFWPNERIFLWGVLPVPARLMVMGLAGIAIYSGFSGMGAGIAHFAHLGGFVGGWLFLGWRERRVRKWRETTAPSAFERISSQLRNDAERWKTIPLERLHPINREEAERVLKKLEISGHASLSADERAFLDRMSGGV